MSRADRIIADLTVRLRESEEERDRLAGQRHYDREAARRALAQHPHCERCAAMQAALDLARDTIDQMAASRPA